MYDFYCGCASGGRGDNDSRRDPHLRPAGGEETRGSTEVQSMREENVDRESGVTRTRNFKVENTEEKVAMLGTKDVG